jgi:hypothetical protein
MAVLVGVVLAMANAAGCSGDDDGAGDDGVAGSVAAPSSSPTTTDGVDVSASSAAAAPSTTTSITAVAEEGVPGIDSADPFCRAWSEFAGSFQALTFASAAGPDPLAAARLEVLAADAVVSAVQHLEADYPEPIVDERSVFVDDVIGPFSRRAARALDELRSVGLSPAEIELLGDAWLVALAEAGLDEPEIVVAVPADLDAAVETATVAFAANLPPIIADPSLITEAEAPATFDYLAGRCPDQGTLAGNDAID